MHFDTDGNLLIDSRYTWTVYKVDACSGAIVWRLGGKDSSFTLKAAPGQSLDHAAEIFAYQHDPEAVGAHEYTVFDDESAGGTPQYSTSRAVTVRLDLSQHTATLVASDDQPEGLVTPAQGNVQTLPSGDLVVGWGGQPYVSVFSPSGTLLYNARYATGAINFRAFVLPWPPAGSGS